MSEPKKPVAPVKPEPPSEYEEAGVIYEPNYPCWGEAIALQDVLDACKAEQVDPSTVSLYVNYYADYGDAMCLTFQAYSKSMVKKASNQWKCEKLSYQENLASYEKKLAKYKKEMAEYPAKLKTWKEKEIERLSKELKKLEEK